MVALHPKRIPTAPRAAIVDSDHAVYVSAVSIWEIAIKRTRGRLTAPDDLQSQLLSQRID